MGVITSTILNEKRGDNIARNKKVISLIKKVFNYDSHIKSSIMEYDLNCDVIVTSAMNYFYDAP